jgi:hypothetical protein
MAGNSGTRRMRRRAWAGAAAAIVCALMFAGVAPAQATPRPDIGWYMLVNDYYDGGSGDDDGVYWCLSTNAQTSPAGANTHYVYLAKCNSNTPAQWWYHEFPYGDDLVLINWQNFGGNVWELSANNSYAYTAQHNVPVETHHWNVTDSTITATNTYFIRNNGLVSAELSASSGNPPFAGTKSVYPASFSLTAPAHKWRFWHPADPPSCSPCGSRF